MGNLGHQAARLAASKICDNIVKGLCKDPETEVVKLIDMWQKFMGDEKIDLNYDSARKMICDKDCTLNKYMHRLINEIDPHVLKTIALNLGFEAFVYGTKTIRKNREKYGCNVPWLILMDPTSACNLHCTGCWAAEYGHKLNLTFDEMDKVVTQGKELGVYLYMFTGGEPLVRKADLVKLCEKHSDCAFLAFTNGTLVDEAFCADLKRIGNLYLAISLEGFSEVNDLRRGTGVFAKVMHAMDLLKENGLVFGTSICYTSKNYKTVTSDEFIDMIVEKGCRYALYFHYMPVGNDASLELLPNPQQRLYIKDRVREIRNMTSGKGIFTMDFQNDGEASICLLLCLAHNLIRCALCNKQGRANRILIPAVFFHLIRQKADFFQQRFILCISLFKRSGQLLDERIHLFRAVSAAGAELEAMIFHLLRR